MHRWIMTPRFWSGSELMFNRFCYAAIAHQKVNKAEHKRRSLYFAHEVLLCQLTHRIVNQHHLVFNSRIDLYHIYSLHLQTVWKH
jgi:hypothetical protein